MCAFTGEAQGCGLAEEFFTGFELAALPWGHDERCWCKCALECGGRAQLRPGGKQFRSAQRTTHTQRQGGTYGKGLRWETTTRVVGEQAVSGPFKRGGWVADAALFQSSGHVDNLSHFWLSLLSKQQTLLLVTLLVSLFFCNMPRFLGFKFHL